MNAYTISERNGLEHVHFNLQDFVQTGAVVKDDSHDDDRDNDSANKKTKKTRVIEDDYEELDPFVDEYANGGADEDAGFDDDY